MSMRRMFVAAVILILTVSLAHAALLSMTVTGQYASSYSNFGDGLGGTPTPINSGGYTLPDRFDSSLGTLYGITVTTTGAQWSNTYGRNDSTLGPIRVGRGGSGGLGVFGPGFGGAGFQDDTSSSLLFPSGQIGSPTFVIPATNNPLDTNVHIDPSFFAEYIFSGPGSFTPGAGSGSSTVAIGYFDNNGASISGSTTGLGSGGFPRVPYPDWYTAPNTGPFVWSVDYGTRLDITIQYDYETSDPAGVPEPCTLALLGVGAIGMGLRARRKKAPTAG